MEEIEVWKPLLGYEGHYEISTFGRVKSLPRVVPHSAGKTLTIKGRMKKVSGHTCGYVMMCLSLNGKNELRLMHQLMLENFVGPKPFKDAHGCHNDGDRKNNRLSNLRWDTASGNFADRVKHGTHQLGEQNASAKLNETDVRKIRALRAKGLSYSKIAAVTNFKIGNIAVISRGQTWKHLAAAE